MLYPKMRERLPGYRLNPNSPLYRGLKLAPLDPTRGWSQDLPVYFRSETWTDPRGFHHRSRMDQVLHNPTYHRPAIRGGHVGIVIPTMSAFFPTESWTLAWREIYLLGDRTSMAFCIYNSDYTVRKLGAWRSSDWPHVILNGVQIDYHRGIQNSVARYRPGTNGFEVIGYASTTATLPTFEDTDHIVAWNSVDDGTNIEWLIDVMYWTRALSDNEVTVIMDDTNVDYRIGGVPLILPPRRQMFPATTAEVAALLFRRTLHQRAGSRGAIV